jgi:hypothetical protein
MLQVETFTRERIDREQQENDLKEASRNVYGLRSFLSPNLCQYCGSPSGLITVWTNPDDITDGRFTLENCRMCNWKGEKC